MVKANNASEFRAIVQELTGQNSDVRDGDSDDLNDLNMMLLTEELNVQGPTNDGYTPTRYVDSNDYDRFFNDIPSGFEVKEGFSWREFSDNFFGIQ